MKPIVNADRIEKWKAEFGFDLAAWVPLPRPVSFQFYSNWLKAQRHGEMSYLETQKPQKEDPRNLLPSAQSLFVVGVRYKPHPEPVTVKSGLKIASYAQGRDYHEWLAERLKAWSLSLKSEIPELETLIATDSKPFLERDLAQQAGLGWIGKNTCLIHPKEGSFFFIAEALTNLEVASDPSLEPVPDFCGQCRRCIEACPTGAILEPRLLDARKCISYWTIESKSVPPTELRSQIGSHFFGCDICQDVCPWNEKVFRRNPLPPPAPLAITETEELRFFLTSSNRAIEAAWGASPVLRARPRGLRRNAMIVAANRGLRELEPEIREWTTDLELGELATWALEKLRSGPIPN